MYLRIWSCEISSKGVQGKKCMTGRRLVSLAVGHQKNFWNPLYFSLRILIDDLRLYKNYCSCLEYNTRPLWLHNGD